MSEAKSDVGPNVSIHGIQKGKVVGYIGDDACEVWAKYLANVHYGIMIMPAAPAGHIIEFDLDDYGLNMDMWRRSDSDTAVVFVERVKVIFGGLAFALNYCPDTPYIIFLDNGNPLLQRNI